MRKTLDNIKMNDKLKIKNEINKQTKEKIMLNPEKQNIQINITETERKIERLEQAEDRDWFQIEVELQFRDEKVDELNRL